MVKDFVISADIGGTADRTLLLFRVPVVGAAEKMTFEAGTWTQENAVDGAKVVSIRNATKNRAITASLTINGLGANASANLVAGSGVNKDVEPADVVSLFYDVTTAGTVAPGHATVWLRFRTGFAGGVIGG